MAESVFAEAERIIIGPRRDAYGDPRKSFDTIGIGFDAIWSLVHHSEGQKLTPSRAVVLSMIWLKMCREMNAHDRDNIVDIIGYAGLLQELSDPR